MTRAEKHAHLFRLAVALGHPVSAEGVWPSFTTSRVTSTTSFVPAPGTEGVEDLTTGDIDRLTIVLEDGPAVDRGGSTLGVG